MKNIQKILVANRGEIAARIIRTAREMGISTVAIYSEDDQQPLHKALADESWSLGSGNLRATYLNIPRIVEIARKSGSEAIHPGYGFLAENPQLPKACRENGLVFIGPSEEAIKTMGNKLKAADFLASLDIPLLDLKTGTPDELASRVSEEYYPLIIKAAAGGGGKGMRIVRDPARLKETLHTTAREAANYFDHDTVYIEKYLDNPRHIEIQVFADQQDNCIHLFERECSIQRRHQKIIEEAPSPTISQKTRQEMGEAAVRIARAIGYTGAGTVEFLVDPEEQFYFLEMNTRIQVEHPVTEMVTGTDLVREQIRIAMGASLAWDQKDLEIRGHALEVRVYAEDPENQFLPAPGKIVRFKAPEGQYIRTDEGIRSGETINADYDPMIAKVIAWGEDRSTAIERMQNALGNSVITGIRHNIPYLKEILHHSDFRNNELSTHFIENHHNKLIDHIHLRKGRFNTPALLAAYIFVQSIPNHRTREQVWGAIGYWRNHMQWNISVDEREYACRFTRYGNMLNLRTRLEKEHRFSLADAGDDWLIIKSDHDQVRAYYVDKQRLTEIIVNGYTFRIHHTGYLDTLQNKHSIHKSNHFAQEINAPMFGKVISIEVNKDMTVKKGQTLMVLEAMKMENNIQAPYDATIKHIAVQEGEQVSDGQLLLETYNN